MMDAASNTFDLACDQDAGDAEDDALLECEADEVVFSDLGDLLRIEGLKVVEGCDVVAIPLQDRHRGHDDTPRELEAEGDELDEATAGAVRGLDLDGEGELARVIGADEVELVAAVVVRRVLEQRLCVKEGGGDDKVAATIGLCLADDALLEELLERDEIEVLAIHEADIIVTSSL